MKRGGVRGGEERVEVPSVIVGKILDKQGGTTQPTRKDVFWERKKS